MQTYFVTAVNYKRKSIYSIVAPVGKILSYAEFQIWHHDPQHNDTYHNDIWHNDIQHKGIWQNEIWHEDVWHNDIKDITLRIITFSIMKFGITTFGIKISSITTLAITIKNTATCVLVFNVAMLKVMALKKSIFILILARTSASLHFSPNSDQF